ncbi:hypothetical protein CJF31_00006246 [Rutstroemia sp. NJR-2017a BVV2]|nr:hypothetical protein CJF31_00006246 [Rutstroemia sp. NJR-2017a BVV2]
MGVFTFPKLVPELRCKIWHLAAHSTPRILEIQAVWNANGRRACKEYKVTSKTNRTPTMMHINRESRTEAMRIYQKYIFSTSDDVGYSWFNPHLDIIYFSFGRCTRVMEILLSRHPEITKIAFPWQWHTDLCWDCGFRDDLASDINPFRIWRALKKSRFPAQCDQPASHTGPGNHTRSEPVPGANTREVYFVLRPQLMSSKFSGINSGVTFGPPGYVFEMKNSRFSSAWECEEEYYSCIDTKVKSVSLAPPMKQTRGTDLKHSFIIVPTLDFSKLDFLKEPFPELLSRTGCEIEVSKFARPGFTGKPDFYELGIYNGTDEEIEEVKCAIKKKIEEASS